MATLKSNPRNRLEGDWFKPAKYPEDVFVCPLCGRPETTGVYKKECHCWDDQKKSEGGGEA